MSRFKPLLVHSAHSARFVNQMSQANAFAPVGGRGRSVSARRRVSVPILQPDRDGFLDFWAGLMRRKCGSAAAVAQMFCVTEQTGRNWMAGFSCPVGEALDLAMTLWPREFAARYLGAA